MPNVKSNRRLIISLPSMVATKEFRPTGLMIKAISVYLLALDKDRPLLPREAVIEAEGSENIWYIWLKKPLFLKWWNQAIAEYHSHIGLSNVHNALYKSALKTVGAFSADRKTFLERFDKDYKPATSQEHSFPGIAPPDETEQAVERSRQRAEQFKTKAIESKEVQGQVDPPPPSFDGENSDI